jgi:hypothetical protein
MYTATAHGYGDVFEGEPITVPVPRHPIRADPCPQPTNPTTILGGVQLC